MNTFKFDFIRRIRIFKWKKAWSIIFHEIKNLGFKGSKTPFS